MLHLKVLRSPHAHARIVAIDRDKALRRAGRGRGLHLGGRAAPALQHGDPRGPSGRSRRHLHAGQRRRASSASASPRSSPRPRPPPRPPAGCSTSTYEILPAVFDPVAAMAPDAPVLHDKGGAEQGQHLRRHPRRGRQRRGRLRGRRRRARDDLLDLARSARAPRDARLHRLARRRRPASRPHQLAGAVHRPAEALPPLRPAAARRARLHRARRRRLRRQAGDALRGPLRARTAQDRAGR